MKQNYEIKKTIAVLVSGNGTNLQCIIDSIEAGELNATISIVISNVADAFALKRAESHGIPFKVIEHSGFSSRKEYDTELVEVLKQSRVELVVLAGFMRILSNIMVDAFPNSIINIHPALLPAFPGLHAQQQALDYGVRYSGCTVHFVDGGTDTGPIILQSVVPVLQDDTEETLSARIQKEEHKIYPQAIKILVAGKIHVNGRHVQIDG